ncbi:alpha-methylacyl-racemase [Stylonychia lemnae]|uniref:Alpha-methylacyl-racemase n=1 Tax=Stylonychia lemnae TaxID=5949 RepID=A0A077ZW83_STYLE|nr:alpha-methylacyl-racemase [Stylonychia lemnae]|eukprot:CDW74205.1 alpha-methylacyl-racemase [Stylonychia lemnae]
MDSALIHVQGSPNATQKIQQQSSMFMQVANIASVAILSSMAFSYVLDKVKDRQEKNLREEIKDRVESTLRENHERIRALEIENNTIKSELVNKNQVDQILNEKLEQMENGKLMGDVKTRALNLKLRANQVSNHSQIHQQPRRGQSSLLGDDQAEKDPLKEDIENLKIEMVRELRDLKQVIKDSMTNNTDILNEMKKFNQGVLNQLRSRQLGSESQPLDEKSDSLKIEVKLEDEEFKLDGSDKKQEESKEQEKPVTKIEPKKFAEIELNEEQLKDIRTKFEEMINQYQEKKDKMNILRSLGFPFQNMIKDSTKNRFDLNGGLFKNLDKLVPGNIAKFLMAIGFKQRTETLYEYEVPKDDVENPDSMLGNKNVLEAMTGQMLADQGAHVIVVKSKGNNPSKLQFMNRGKSSIILNLKKDRDRAFLLNDVIPHIDIILESYRPGVMEKLGLSPDIVHDNNSKVIYARLSGYGQVESKQRELAGHDMNYLAITGLLNKFKRVSKNNAPTPPANIVADFASGSLYCFNLILQALYLKKPNTTIDCSLTHSTAYLSQLVLMETVKITSKDKIKDKNAVVINNFTRPHETVYRDLEGVCFVLKPGSKIHDDARLQFYGQDEGDESHQHQDLYQLVFEKMTIKDIEQKYGPVEVIRQYGNLLENNTDLPKGLVTKIEDQIQVMNVFDLEKEGFQTYGGKQEDGWKSLEQIGVQPEKISKFQELKQAQKKEKNKTDFKPKL